MSDDTMDDLDSLPLSKEENTRMEREVLDKYFPPLEDESSSKLKLIGYAILLFFLCNIPLVVNIFRKIELCNGNEYCITMVRAIAFGIALFLLLTFG